VSEVIPEHLQNLMSLGYMTVVELATCCVPEDPASPAPMGDTSWCVRRSTSEDLLCLHIDSPLAAIVLCNTPCYEEPNLHPNPSN
jgi:hypothetical protein